MAVEIGALRAMLSLDSAAFDKGIKRAQAGMNRFQKTMSKASQSMNRIGKTLTTRLTLPLVGLGTVAVRSSLKTIDAQAKMAQSFDTSVVSIQNLARASDLAGISQGDLEGSLRRMTRRVSLAERDMGPAKKALDQLGLSAKNLSNIPIDERVRTINAAIREFIPEAQQAAVASQIFGDQSGLAMLRLNNATLDQATNEVQEFGVAVSDVDAKGIERANDALSGLASAGKGLANQLTVALAPVLERIAEKLQELQQWFSGLSPRMKKLAGVIGVVAAAAGPAAIAVGALAAAIGAISLPLAAVLGLGAAAGGIWLTLGENTSEAEQAMNAAKEAQKALNAAMGTFYETSAPSAGRAAIDAANANYDLAESAMAAAKAEIAKRTAQLDALEGGVETSRRSGLRQGAQGQLEQARAQLVQAKKMLEEAELARNRTARSVTGSMSLAMEDTANATSDLKVNIGGLGDVATGAGGKVESAMDRAKESIESASVASDRWASNMASHFDGLITGGKKFSDVLQSMARQLESRAWQQLFSGLGGGFGGGGGGKGLLGMGNFLGFLDSGGRIGAGQFAVAGERRPEIVTGPANVIGGAETARIMQGQAAGGGRSVVELVLSPDLEARLLEKSANQSVEISMAVSQETAKEQQRNIGGAVQNSQLRGSS